MVISTQQKKIVALALVTLVAVLAYFGHKQYKLARMKVQNEMAIRISNSDVIDNGGVGTNESSIENSLNMALANNHPTGDNPDMLAGMGDEIPEIMFRDESDTENSGSSYASLYEEKQEELQIAMLDAEISKTKLEQKQYEIETTKLESPPAVSESSEDANSTIDQNAAAPKERGLGHDPRLIRRQAPKPKTSYDLANLVGVANGSTAYIEVNESIQRLGVGGQYEDFTVEAIGADSVVIGRRSTGVTRALRIPSNTHAFQHPKIEIFRENQGGINGSDEY